MCRVRKLEGWQNERETKNVRHLISSEVIRATHLVKTDNAMCGVAILNEHDCRHHDDTELLDEVGLLLRVDLDKACFKMPRSQLNKRYQ